MPCRWASAAYHAYGRYAKDRGVNALDLLGAEDGQGFLPYVSTRVSVKLTGDYKKVARTDGTARQLGRGIVQAMPLADAIKGLDTGAVAA